MQLRVKQNNRELHLVSSHGCGKVTSSILLILFTEVFWFFLDIAVGCQEDTTEMRMALWPPESKWLHALF